MKQEQEMENKAGWFTRWFFPKKEKSETTTKEHVSGFLWALVIAIVIRTFLFQPFNIPSGSMIPTLLIGDFLFVSKYSYGYSHYSLPFGSDLFKGRVFRNAPTQGDIVVFTGDHCATGFGYIGNWVKRSLGYLKGADDDVDYIKRLIGLPGDRVQMRKGILYVNDVEAKLQEDGHLTIVDSRGNVKVIPRFIETLPNGIKHTIIKNAPFGMGNLDNTPEFVVPEGHYFVMGDNRDGSNDSRAMDVVKFVPEDNLLGKAQIIFFSTEAKWWDLSNWLSGLRLSRLFSWIR